MRWKCPVALFGVAATLAGCATGPIVSPFSPGPVDPRSAVAADVAEAARTPGSYPHFAAIPPVPNDVRPALAWRSAVRSELTEKQSVEAEAAATPFTLGDSEAWAQAELAKIPQGELKPVAPDEAAASEAYAAAQRARATPPPAPQ